MNRQKTYNNDVLSWCYSSHLQQFLLETDLRINTSPRLSVISWPPRPWRKILLNRQFQRDLQEVDRQLMTQTKRLRITLFPPLHYYLDIILQPDTVLIWIQCCNSRFDPLNTFRHYAFCWTCRSYQLLCTTANQGPQWLIVMSLKEMFEWKLKAV